MNIDNLCEFAFLFFCQLKVAERDIKKYQSLNAKVMFNSRGVKTVKVLKEGDKHFVKANIYRSFSNGITRNATIMFRRGKPSKGHCECTVRLSGLYCYVICLLLYLEHFTLHGETFIALTCTQGLQKWHGRGNAGSKQTQLCRVPLSHLRNLSRQFG